MAWIATKLCQNAFRTISDVSFFDAEQKKSSKMFDRNFHFSSIWRGFRRSTAERTSKSASPSNFALDRLILRSVRPQFDQNMSIQVLRWVLLDWFLKKPSHKEKTNQAIEYNGILVLHELCYKCSIIGIYQQGIPAKSHEF